MMLSEDNLRHQLSKCVPKKVTEEQFWTSYFYSIEKVKEKTIKKFKGGTQTSSSSSKDKELLEELADLETELGTGSALAAGKKKKKECHIQGSSEELKLLKEQLNDAL